MNRTIQLIGMFTLAVALLVVAYLNAPSNIAFSGTNIANEYQGTTTIGMADGHRALLTDVPATLGSIVIGSSSPTSFVVWNATSTTDIASTSVVTLRAEAGEGSYSYDILLDRGLVIELPTGFNGSYNVTFRQR